MSTPNTVLHRLAAETAERLTRNTTCQQCQKRLLNAAQQARARAAGEK